MALPRKARKITIDGLDYRWMTSRNSDVLSVPVFVQEAAGRGSVLEFAFPVETEWVPINDTGDYRLAQKTSVTPANIRETVVQALELGWDPLTPKRLPVRCDWEGKLRLAKSYGITWTEIDDHESWNKGDPLAALTSYLTEYGKPHPKWVEKWSTPHPDPLQNVWEATIDPGVMMDVLEFSRACKDLVNILHAFAFRKGKVAEILSLETMGFEMGTGWQRHIDGTNERLSDQEKLRSIREDIEILCQRAREHASISEFRIDFIEATDIGTHGDWLTFRRVTADIIRSIAPKPPDLETLTKAWCDRVQRY